MPPKKAAKKSPGQHDPNKPAKDARRTFEHLGRVQALSSLASTERDVLTLLTKTADNAFAAKQFKESADVLRAAEHLSFAALHSHASETVAPDLKAAIQQEFKHLTERSAEHASHHDTHAILHPIITRMTTEATAAMQRGSYRSALEFARAAEALSHVHPPQTSALPSPATAKHLKD